MSTAMAMALKLACYECSIKNPNPGSEKRLLLVTDGFDTVGGNVTIVADSMKAKGKNIYI